MDSTGPISPTHENECINQALVKRGERKEGKLTSSLCLVFGFSHSVRKSSIVFGACIRFFDFNISIASSSVLPLDIIRVFALSIRKVFFLFSLLEFEMPSFTLSIKVRT